jgi:HTH-type transcriptional regulator, sugar sensing transcriptional regulator
MIVQKSLLLKLKEFGLNIYESKLWTALLSMGVATAGELSDVANVPRSRTYDVLESLEKKGFIIMKLGKPIKYIAVPPSEVVERVKKKIVIDANQSQDMLEKLKGSETMDELNTLHTQGIEMVEPTDLSGSIRGRDNIYNHLETMIKSAKESVHILTTEEGVKRKSKELMKSLRKAADGGVSIKIAAPLSKDIEDSFSKLSGKVTLKNIETPSTRFCIIDNKEIAFFLTDDSLTHPSYETCVWVKTPQFSKSVSNAFDF